MHQDDLNLGLRSTGISKIFENPRSKIRDNTVLLHGHSNRHLRPAVAF